MQSSVLLSQKYLSHRSCLSRKYYHDVFPYGFKFSKSEIKVFRVYSFLFPEEALILGWPFGISFGIRWNIQTISMIRSRDVYWPRYAGSVINRGAITGARHCLWRMPQSGWAAMHMHTAQSTADEGRVSAVHCPRRLPSKEESDGSACVCEAGYTSG